MNFFVGLLVWIIIAAFLAAGVVLAAKGSMILLVVGLLVFGAAFVKYGCLSH